MRKILVVDDSEIIRSLLEEYLGDLGYEVDLAADGAEGIEMALAGSYQVVFCDIHMPRKNGYEVYKEVMHHKPELRFIMTDSLPDQLAEMAQQAGACCCLQKPFELAQIKRMLDNLFAALNTACAPRSTTS